MNKNLIPYDTRKPLDPSGVRFGTAALTTRGLKEDAFKQVAGWIIAVVEAPEDAARIESIRKEIQAFTSHYPVPADIA